MSWCDHWLFQYEKNCVGMRIAAEHPTAAVWFATGILLLLAALAIWRWRAE